MKRLIMCCALLCASVVPPALAKNTLRGSHHSLVYQNRVADRQNLSRLHEKQLKKFKRGRILVRLPKGKTTSIDRTLPPEYRWCRPQTRAFIVDLSRHFYAKFHARLKVTSALRTYEYQRKLIRKNGNAARGDTRLTQSSHLTGATVDITKKGLPLAQVTWLRARLKSYERVRMIEATEEFRQSVFHIMVIRWRT